MLLRTCVGVLVDRGLIAPCVSFAASPCGPTRLPPLLILHSHSSWYGWRREQSNKGTTTRHSDGGVPAQSWRRAKSGCTQQTAGSARRRTMHPSASTARRHHRKRFAAAEGSTTLRGHTKDERKSGHGLLVRAAASEAPIRGGTRMGGVQRFEERGVRKAKLSLWLPLSPASSHSVARVCALGARRGGGDQL